MNSSDKNDGKLFLALKLATENIITEQRNPFSRYDPRNFSKIKEAREAVRYIRQVGLGIITERINLLKNKEQLPNDLLSSIIKTASR